MDKSNVIEIPGFLQDKIVKKITFATEGIKVETKGPMIFLPAENINAFRFRVTYTRGYRFVIGRQYVIETKDFNNKVFEIKLSSLYGIRRKAYYKAWSAIFNQLWVHYFNNTLNYYIDLYNVHQVFELAGVKFNTDGISWDKKNKLQWHEIALNNYKTYFMIRHIDNPLQNKSCSFSMDWNAFILQCLLKNIVQEHRALKKIR